MNSTGKPGSSLNVHELIGDIETAALAQGFRVETFGRIGEFPLIALTRRNPGPRPRIYISAGLHGDEPAPPLALLTMLRAGFFSNNANWFICPVLNPEGLQAATRENVDQCDLNRDYQDRSSLEVQAHTRWLGRQPPFDLTLCLHEDWESTGFYLYELNPRARPTLADKMIQTVSGLMPIEPASIIDGRPIAEPGIIRPVSDPLLRTNWPEAIFLSLSHTTLSYTLETPSTLPVSDRIGAMQAAVAAAVTSLIRD
uniref:M14 family metallopeptidase n=1 Tax=Cephaloticoccus sp. TaxID=1985742 RepID=UPI00404B453D